MYRAGDLIEGEERRRGRKKEEKKRRKRKKGGKKKSRRDACAAAVTAAATVAFVGQWNTVPVVAITSTAALAAVHQAASTRLATRASRSSSWLCGFREGFSTLPRGEQSSSFSKLCARSYSTPVVQLSSYTHFRYCIYRSVIVLRPYVKRSWSILGEYASNWIYRSNFSLLNILSVDFLNSCLFIHITVYVMVVFKFWNFEWKWKFRGGGELKFAWQRANSFVQVVCNTLCYVVGFFLFLYVVDARRFVAI